MTTATAWQDWSAQRHAAVDAAYRGRRTSPMAIIAILAAVAGWTIFPGVGVVAAVVLGSIAIAGCRRTGDGGMMLAIGALGLGILGIVLGLVGIVQFTALIVTLIVTLMQTLGAI